MKINHILKFSKINRFMIDSLVHSQIYFAPPEKLNDPFDCQVGHVGIIKAIKAAIAKLSGSARQTLQDFLQNDELQQMIKSDLEDIKNAGVFCATHKPSLLCPLMWSHYADAHRGVCLVYAIPESFINLDTNNTMGISCVEYGYNPLTDWFVLLPSKDDEYQRHAYSEMIKKVLTVKSTCWKYEDEVRIIRKIAGAVSIDRSYLQHICFGINTSKDDRSLISQIIKHFNYDVKYSEMQRSQNDFGLTESVFSLHAVDI